MPMPAEFTPALITTVYEKFGTFMNPFADLFGTMPNELPGSKVTYDVVEYKQSMSPLVARHGPAYNAQAPTRCIVTYECLSLKEKLALAPEVIDMRRAGSLTASGVDQAINQAIRQLRLNFEKRTAWMQAQWLTFGGLLSSVGVVPTTAANINGDVYLDYNSLSNATPQKVTLGITATHADTAVAASWATSTTDIKSHLDQAQGVVEADSGVTPTLVLLNRQTWAYIMVNDLLEQSMKFADARAFDSFAGRTGPGYKEYDLWGYTWRVTNSTFPIRSESMVTTAGNQYLIPNNVVVLMPKDNTEGGRYMIECSPSDANAPQGARGLWSWQDTQNEHPHATSYGLEWHGGPCFLNPDTNYVFTNVTQT